MISSCLICSYLVLVYVISSMQPTLTFSPWRNRVTYQTVANLNVIPVVPCPTAVLQLSFRVANSCVYTVTHM